MPNSIRFRAYSPSDKESCLRIFDNNCPLYFAENERKDYEDFLDGNPVGYEVCIGNGDIVGAFGLCGSAQRFRDLNWILIDQNVQGMGVGSKFMTRAINTAERLNIEQIKIAASHLSAPFFAKYGAIEICKIENGWGPGMHRIDMELNLS
ncbi:N-acetyltransferase [Vibrio sp. T187]|uniref:GNAT family N-acetyltransferase n=1 Tax=Vibrio TaxID=662 RepID=UPI0010C9DC46|nr:MULTISPECIES: GNAT family N-acetyltransferase [Vibrio]MBW3694902.1 N-acetyltransferase [Vibrio sp. T187]